VHDTTDVPHSRPGKEAPSLDMWIPERLEWDAKEKYPDALVDTPEDDETECAQV